MGLCTTACLRILQILAESGTEDKSLCMIGRQNIGIEWNSYMRIVDRISIPYDKEVYAEIRDIYPVDTYQFFKMFGLKDVHAIDYTAEDGADIIFNLNDNLPDELNQKYDYVINGGTLEHVFDIAKAMANVSNMVKVGGVIIHLAPLAGYVDHGFYSFSPTFFTDYYSENYFEIKNIDMAFYLDKPIESEWKTIYSQDCRLFTDCREINSYLKTINFITDIGRCMLWCIAKRKETTNIVYPIQEIYSKRYREKEIYRDSLKKTDKNVIQMEKVIKFFKKNAYKSVTAFCAGDICGRVIDELIKNDMEDYIELIFDSDISKAGTFYRGYQIVYPTVKKLHEAVVILICSDKYEDEIFDMLLDKGLQKHMIYKITEIT